MTDADKLRLVADWFDVFDQKMPRLVEALTAGGDPDLAAMWCNWTASDAVQRDLRRIADLLEMALEATK